MRRIYQIDGEETECWLSHDGRSMILNTPDGAIPCQLDAAEAPADAVAGAVSYPMFAVFASGSLDCAAMLDTVPS